MGGRHLCSPAGVIAKGDFVQIKHECAVCLKAEASWDVMGPAQPVGHCLVLTSHHFEIGWTNLLQEEPCSSSTPADAMDKLH
jgi:hypothetical protein